MKKAHSSIYLSSFGLNDPHVIKILKQKAKEIPITFVCAPSEKKHISKKIHPSIQCQTTASSGLLHEKILLIDEGLIFLGSTNLTNTSLSMHDNLILGIYSPDLSNLLENRQPNAHFSYLLEGQRMHVYLLPEKDNQCLDHIASAIMEAKQEIKIALFTLTHPKILQALKIAKEQNIHIEIILDQFSAKGSCRQTVEFLKNHQIPLKKSTKPKLMHHKWALIDQKIFITGSANWTRAAFSKNHDYILVFPSLNKSQLKIINKIWNKLQLESKLI